MASEDSFSTFQDVNFQQCTTQILAFVYNDDEACRSKLNFILDELNSLDYPTLACNDETGCNLLVKICSLVPVYQELLLTKVCYSISTFVSKQKIALTERCLFAVTEYLIQALLRCQSWVQPDILRSLAFVIHENVGNTPQFHDRLLGSHGILLQIIHQNTIDDDVFRAAIWCLESIAVRPAGQDYLNDDLVMTCFDVLLQVLHTPPTDKTDPISHCKLLISTLRGIHNLVPATRSVPPDYLGPILAALKVYMLHGLPSQPSVVPQSLYPMPLHQYDPNQVAAPKRTISRPEQNKGADGTYKPQPRKQKKRRQMKKGHRENEDDYNTTMTSGSAVPTDGDYVPGSIHTFQPSWVKIASSDSDYSDTEGGEATRLRAARIKVRQLAQGCLQAISKNIDKRVMFGYWPSLLPDSPQTGNITPGQTIFTVVLRDPSPMVRMGALATLTVLFDGSKSFLAAAEDSDQARLSFTPFSVILGTSIKEIHRCLLLALVAENIPLTVTQLIKCIGTLVQNVPYHRLRPGLLGRIVKQVRHFLNNKDPNVRVACLTCFGSMASIQPPLLEICHIFQPSHPPVGTRYVNPNETNAASSEERELIPTESTDSGFSSSPNTTTNVVDISQIACLSIESNNSIPGSSSGSVTPTLASSPGVRTPIFSDQTLQAHARDTSWLIKVCIKNIIPQPLMEGELPRLIPQTEMKYYEPLPVRLESLQVLAHLTKGYFPIIRSSMILLRDLVQRCLQDDDPIVRLHGAKLLNELSTVLLNELAKAESDLRIDVAQVLEFWLFIFSGPLPSILQEVGLDSLRAAASECLANIGPDVFQKLPVDKSILCITLTLGLTSDDDRLVRASAVRTLGFYNLYPCLREDVSFIADSANAILMCMDDPRLNVRVKASWSLGNLCDALVLNKEEGDAEFIEDFSDLLLLKMLPTAVKAAHDSDKVRSNAVRSIGALLRYMPERIIMKISIRDVITEAVQALLKNIGTGVNKVQWNACYGIGNTFKNTGLPLSKTDMDNSLQVLCGVVQDSKNHKVRINAATALSCPAKRSMYGDHGLWLLVWQSLIAALDTAESITEFSQFRYRENLIDQICSTIVHLVTVIALNDLESMHSLMKEKAVVLADYMNKYRSNEMETRSSIGSQLSEALVHLETLSDPGLTSKASEVLGQLQTICNPITPTNLESMVQKAEKSSFVQTYD